MGEADKPFACPLSDCGMKFTNEDHLTVHKKKHDMSLNFNNGQKMNAFVADQTPTPTRFIRNCEEVGLFQDLQNVNPFEEQFRKAAEAAKTGSTPLPESELMCGPVDDTLHTPQVYPNLDAHHRRNEPVLAPTLDPTDHVPPAPPKSNNKDTSVQLLLRLPDGKLVKLSAVEMAENETSNTSSSVINMPSIVVDEPSSSGHTTRTVLLSSAPMRTMSADAQTPSTPSSTASDASDRLAMAKQKLKQAISANRRKETSTSTQLPANTPVKESRTLLVMKSKAPEQSDPTPAPTSSKRTRELSGSSGDDNSQKRQKFLERNRAAASRCRQKRKHWVSTLERRADLMHATNQQLVAEVGSLRSEVAQLKTLLLAHRDCPVTKAMCQSGVLQLVETNETNVRVPTIVNTSVINVAPAARASNIVIMQPSAKQKPLQPLLMPVAPADTSKASEPQARRSGVLKFVHNINKETVIIQNVNDK